MIIKTEAFHRLVEQMFPRAWAEGNEATEDFKAIVALITAIDPEDFPSIQSRLEQQVNEARTGIDKIDDWQPFAAAYDYITSVLDCRCPLCYSFNTKHTGATGFNITHGGQECETDVAWQECLDCQHTWNLG